MPFLRIPRGVEHKESAMKKCLLIVAFIAAAASLCGQSYDQALRKLVNAMSDRYKKTVTDEYLKPAVSLVSFSNNTDAARRYNIGNLLRDKLTKLLSLSTVFVVVERENLDKQLAEIELSLSGLTEGKTPAKLQLLDVQYLLSGSVSEEADDFVLTIKLIGVSDSTVVFSDSAKLPKSELIAEYESIRKNVAQYGLGIEWSMSLLYQLPGHEARGEYNLMQPLTSFFAVYRPLSWLIVGLGTEFPIAEMRFSSDGSSDAYDSYTIPVASIQNMNIDASWPVDVTAIGYQKEISYRLFGVVIGVTVMLLPELYLNAGSYFMLGDVTMLQKYRDVPHPEEPTTHCDFIVQSKSDDFQYITPYFRLQWFFSKRVSLNASYAYRIQVSEKMEFQPGIAGAYAAKPIFPDFWDLNPSLTPDGQPHFLDLSGHYFFFGLGMYF